MSTRITAPGRSPALRLLGLVLAAKTAVEAGDHDAARLALRRLAADSARWAGTGDLSGLSWPEEPKP